MNFPAISQLVQRSRALATLDLILSPEWESRYYSFNARWSEYSVMGSMSNGSGDEWFFLADSRGWAGIKGLDHESKAASKGRDKLSLELQTAIPLGMEGFSQEPAFSWDYTSFAYFCPSDSVGWTRANDLTTFSEIADTGEAELLECLLGGPDDYVEFVAAYYEVEIPIDIVSSIFELQPISKPMLKRFNPEVSLSDIARELFEEIGYPRFA